MKKSIIISNIFGFDFFLGAFPFESRGKGFNFLGLNEKIRQKKFFNYVIKAFYFSFRPQKARKAYFESHFRSEYRTLTKAKEITKTLFQ